MDKKKAIIILNYGFDGGVGTLAIRMADWCKKNQIALIYCANKNNNNCNYNQLTDLGVGIYISKDVSFETQFNSIRDIDTLTECTLLSYITLNHYYGTLIKKKNKNVVNNILYQLGPETVSYDNNSNNWFKRRIAGYINKFIYGEYIKSVINKGQFFVMDDQCKRITQDNMGITINDNLVLRLPYEIDSYSNIYNDIVLPKMMRICTVSRMSFPFKGYILGLVDVFCRLVEEGLEMELFIVGDGESKNVLLEKITNIPLKTRNRIRIIGNVPYKEAKRIIHESTLFIGMGTTIFDAANGLTIAIPVAINTTLLEAKQSFLENPYSIALDTGIGDEMTVSDIIKEVYSMSKDEYEKKVIEQYHLLEKIYSTDHFMNKILSKPGMSYRLQNEKTPAIFQLFFNLKLKKIH